MPGKKGHHFVLEQISAETLSQVLGLLQPDFRRGNCCSSVPWRKPATVFLLSRGGQLSLPRWLQHGHRIPALIRRRCKLCCLPAGYLMSSARFQACGLEVWRLGENLDKGWEETVPKAASWIQPSICAMPLAFQPEVPAAVRGFDLQDVVATQQFPRAPNEPWTPCIADVSGFDPDRPKVEGA